MTLEGCRQAIDNRWPWTNYERGSSEQTEPFLYYQGSEYMTINIILAWGHPRYHSGLYAPPLI